MTIEEKDRNEDGGERIAQRFCGRSYEQPASVSPIRMPAEAPETPHLEVLSQVARSLRGELGLRSRLAIALQVGHSQMRGPGLDLPQWAGFTFFQ